MLPLLRGLPHLPGVIGALALGLVPSAALAETSIERAARTGELTLGVTGPLPPLVESTGQGQFSGYAIDIAGLIAEEVSAYLGKPVTVVTETVSNPAALFTKVHQGGIDLMCGVPFTWEREMFVDFSIPFALSGIRLLTGDNAIDGSPASIRGRNVGVIENSLAAATVKALEPTARLIPVATIEEGVMLLSRGRIQAMAGDSLLLARAARGASTSTMKLVPDEAYNRFAVSCIMPENNSTLRNLVNLALAKMIQGYVNDTPRYTALVNRWIGPGSSVALPEPLIKGYFQTVLLNHEQIHVPLSP